MQLEKDLLEAVVRGTFLQPVAWTPASGMGKVSSGDSQITRPQATGSPELAGPAQPQSTASPNPASWRKTTSWEDYYGSFHKFVVQPGATSEERFHRRLAALKAGGILK